jgi:hypothetical protein
MTRSLDELERVDHRLGTILVSADEVSALIRAGAQIEGKGQAPNGNYTYVMVRFCRTINRKYLWSDSRKDKPGQPAQFLGLPS